MDRTMKRTFKQIVILLMTVMLLAGILPITSFAAAKPNLNHSELTLNVGKSYTLRLTGTTQKVKWSSSKKSVAAVSSKGKVTAKKKGTATITAKVGSKKYTCKVTVKQPVTSVKLNKKSYTLKKKGATVTLKATVKPTNANNRTIKWTTSNKEVATVNSKGKVTAISNGTATITATASDGSKKKASCKITVKIPAIKVTKVRLNKTSASLTKKGQTLQLTATVTPGNATNKTVTWKSSNTKVATVTSSGKVTAVANGTATITATAADGSKKAASCKVTVNIPAPVKVTSVRLNKTSATLTAKGQTAALTAFVTPSNATNKTVTWKSSNTGVATVTSTGKVTAVANGTATITATAADGSGKSATCKITVNIPVSVTGVSLNRTSATLTTKGQTVSLTATVAPSNATNKSVTWSSSNTSVATVSNGLVTAVGNGTATITVTTADGAKKATCTVTVKIPITVTDIRLNRTSATLTAKGQTVNLTATVAPSNADNKAVTWSSSNANVATVSNGTVTAVSNGTATITAAAADGSGKKATCAITVNIPNNVENVSLAGGNSKICGLFYDEIPANVDLSKITFEINGNNNNIDNLGTDYEPGWNTTITIKALKAGNIQILAKYNSTVLRIWNITVTSNWSVYVAYENWKRGVESQIWTSGMSTVQKLNAIQSYIQSNFHYGSGSDGSGSNKYYAYENMVADCYGAAGMFGDMATDIGATVGYVNKYTGQVYPYMSSAVGAAAGHVYTVVQINGQWVNYDSTPPY